MLSRDERYAYEDPYLEALDLRNFEIAQLTQRNNFLMIFQGVLIAGISQSLGQVPVVSFACCLIGIASSILQVLMGSGAKYWQDYWEHRLSYLERRYLKATRGKFHGQRLPRDQIRLFSGYHFTPPLKRDDHKRGPLSAFVDWIIYAITNPFVRMKPSVSRIPIAMGICFAVFWLYLLAHTVNIPGLSQSVLDFRGFIVGFDRT